MPLRGSTLGKGKPTVLPDGRRLRGDKLQTGVTKVECYELPKGGCATFESEKTDFDQFYLAVWGTGILSVNGMDFPLERGLQVEVPGRKTITLRNTYHTKLVYYVFTS